MDDKAGVKSTTTAASGMSPVSSVTPPSSIPKQASHLKFRQVTSTSKLLIAVIFLLLSTGAGFMGGWYGASSRFQNLNQNQQKEVVSSESDLISQIAKDVGPSVVSLNVTLQNNDDIDYFGRSLGDQIGAGTGFIVSEDGVIVTNRHVVPEGTSKVTVVLDNGVELDSVEIIGRTSNNDPLDVAFLKVNDAEGQILKPATLGDSSKMEVGDKVIAIGNALGQFQNSVTSGIISGFGRDVQAGDSSGDNVESLQDLFQTDAAINEGNSGGPLVDINGEVIGINTAVAGDAQNIGFAIPINDVTGLVNSVLKNGKLERPYLGVRYISITDDYAAEKALLTKRGAYIPPSIAASPSIIPDSPAQAAGLRDGDIITKVNDVNINENNNLSSVLARFEVGQKVALTVIRNGQEQKIDVTLATAPQS